MSNLLNQIKQKREEKVRDLYVDLPIPTWDGMLVARFDVLSRADVEKFINKQRSAKADAMFIIKSLREFYLLDESGEAPGTRMDENKDYVRIEGEHGGPVLFDQDLAEMLGIEAEAAVDVLDYMFKGNSLAWSGIAGRLLAWMQNTDMKVAESLVGE